MPFSCGLAGLRQEIRLLFSRHKVSVFPLVVIVVNNANLYQYLVLGIIHIVCLFRSILPRFGNEIGCVFGSRRLLQIPKDLEWEVKRYDDHTLHLVNTDIDDLLDVDDARIAAENAEKKKTREAEAAAAVPAATAPASAETTDNTTDPIQAPPPIEPLVTKEATAGTSEPTEGQTPSLDAMNVEGAPEDGSKVIAGPKGRYYALCLHFTLPAAAYATMCLREITQQDTSTSFHTSLNSLAPGQHPGKEGPAATSEEAAMADVGKGGGIEEDKPGAKILPPKGAVIKIGASLRK